MTYEKEFNPSPYKYNMDDCLADVERGSTIWKLIYMSDEEFQKWFDERLNTINVEREKRKLLCSIYGNISEKNLYDGSGVFIRRGVNFGIAAWSEFNIGHLNWLEQDLRNMRAVREHGRKIL